MPIYRWTKVYAVQTDADDPVKEGDEIEVDSSDGGSVQEVLSATVMHTRSGKPYKTLLLKEVKK